MSRPQTAFETPQAPTHEDYLDLALQPEDYRIMFEDAWSDNERLRRELILRETVLRRLVAEARHLRGIIAQINLVGETLANESEPLPAPDSPATDPGAPQEPEFS